MNHMKDGCSRHVGPTLKTRGVITAVHRVKADVLHL